MRESGLKHIGPFLSSGVVLGLFDVTSGLSAVNRSVYGQRSSDPADP
jgi:hypothetical protein